MTVGPGRRRTIRINGAILIALVAITLAGCASGRALQEGQRAEFERDYDRAVVLYRRALQERPHDRNAQLSLERAMLRAAQQHYAAGRALARQSRWEEALAHYQIAYELNPTMGDIERELAETREAVRTRLAAREGQTQLEALIERTRHAAPPGLELPNGDPMPDAVVFREASARTVFSAIGQFAGVTLVFDPQFVDEPVTADLRGITFAEALDTIARSTRNFFQVTAPGTVTIVPDTPAKRREYQQEVVRTFYLSNADVTETIDLLRLVLDLRRIAPVTATNAVSIMDTPERLDAAARLVQVIDKARAEVVIEVQLLEVDRQTMRDYGLEFAAQGADAALTADGEGFRSDAGRHRPTERIGPVRRQPDEPPDQHAGRRPEHADPGEPQPPDVGRARGRGALRRTGAGSGHHVHADCRGWSGAAADHVLQLRGHRGQHRDRPPHPPQRRSVAGAGGRYQQHLRHRFRRPAKVRQPRDLDDAPPARR